MKLKERIIQCWYYTWPMLPLGDIWNEMEKKWGTISNKQLDTKNIPAAHYLVSSTLLFWQSVCVPVGIFYLCACCWMAGHNTLVFGRIYIYFFRIFLKASLLKPSHLFISSAQCTHMWEFTVLCWCETSKNMSPLSQTDQHTLQINYGG